MRRKITQSPAPGPLIDKGQLANKAAARNEASIPPAGMNLPFQLQMTWVTLGELAGCVARAVRMTGAGQLEVGLLAVGVGWGVNG